MDFEDAVKADKKYCKSLLNSHLASSPKLTDGALTYGDIR